MAGGRPFGYLQKVTDRGLKNRETNPASGSAGCMEALSPGPLDYNTSAPNHSAKKHGKCSLDYSSRNVNSSNQLLCIFY